MYEELCKRAKEDWWFVGRRHIIMSLLKRHLNGKKDLSIIDVGCGAGDVIDSLKVIGNALGVDNDKHIVNFNRENGRDVRFGDINKLDFPDNSFDMVTLLEILEHLEDDRGGIKEAFRVLKPKGMILVTVPAFPFLWSSHDSTAHHKRRYIKSELEKKLIDSGFEIIKITYINSLLFPFIYIFRLLKNLTGEKQDTSDFMDYPPIFNNILKIIFSFEANLIKKINFPFGVSLLVLARKNDK